MATVGLRLNDVTDKDIIEDLSRYKNRSDRIKAVYRIALALERQAVRLPLEADTEAPVVVRPSAPAPIQQNGALDWRANFPTPKPPVEVPSEAPQKAPSDSSEGIKANILGSFST